MPASITWKTVITSSSILSLALVGDALIYAVLPLHAETFGISLIWVGVLLSANRFVRVFAYGWIAVFAQRFGLRRICIVALLAAIVSTAMYGLATGAVALLFARILWGLAFAGLLLVTLGYAVHDRTRVGSRLGWSRAIQHVGPVVALVAGAWLTGFLGPRTVFVWLALLTATALPLALSLPVDRTGSGAPISTRSLGRPTLIDLLFALQGFGVDGVFAVSITLLLAQELPLDLAVLSGASLLAVRHVSDAVGAALFGASGDRHDAGRILVVAMACTAIGFIGIASGFTIAGALLMLFFRSALGVLGPAVVVRRMPATQSVIGDLARMHACTRGAMLVRPCCEISCGRSEVVGIPDHVGDKTGGCAPIPDCRPSRVRRGQPRGIRAGKSVLQRPRAQVRGVLHQPPLLMTSRAVNAARQVNGLFPWVYWPSGRSDATSRDASPMNPHSVRLRIPTRESRAAKCREQIVCPV